VTLIGVLVNPDAGLGGRLGFKGSDGRAEEARKAGAEDRAGPRMTTTLEQLEKLGFGDAEFTTCEGRMGSDWFPDSITPSSTISGADPSSATDTEIAILEFLDLGVDLILYAGGDGTTRDIVTALDKAEMTELPLVGVPAGVKMHSGCFAANTNAAAEVVHAWLGGDLLLGTTEVMDLDEEAYRDGVWKVRLYAEVKTPSSPRWMQGAKTRVEAADEDDLLEGMARHIGEMMEEEPELLVIWGTGGTLRTMARHLGLTKTVLGIDVMKGGKIVASDVTEKSLLDLLDKHSGGAQTGDTGTGKARILLSPMGGQGFLIGRGNLQISPEVIRRVGIDGVLGIGTPAKLLTLRALRIDSGDEALDEEFKLKKYLKVLHGYRTTRLVKVAQE
jgi:predicted polyphosphate/ATP-dependent NAD kinase